MTKWFPQLDEVINDIVNVWEGDAIENIVGDPTTAEMLEDKFTKLDKEDLPTWLDPNIEIGEQVQDAIEYVKGALDQGWGVTKPGPLFGVGLGTLAILGLGLVVVTR